MLVPVFSVMDREAEEELADMDAMMVLELEVLVEWSDGLTLWCTSICWLLRQC